MRKILKKIIYTLMIMILFIQNLSNIVMAATEISKANLRNDHSIKTNIQYKNADGTWHDIICNYICYTEDGNKYPAYCIKHGVNGVDEAGSYTVSISELLDDDRVWRVIINSYPYVSLDTMGVETKDDAYVATKQAINSVLLNRNVRAFYNAKNTKGEKIVDAIEKLTEIGRNGEQKRYDANLDINKVKDLTKYNDNYYYQEYELKSDVDIGSYSIESINDFPEGSYVADISGNEKVNFDGNNRFRIMIPINNITSDFFGSISVKAKCKTYPIFFGKAPKSNVQDYAITYDFYGDFTATETFSEKTNIAKIIVNKKDDESLKPIENVKYELRQEGKIIETKTTNKKGEIIFDNLYKGNYEIQEISTNENYILDNTIYKMKLGFGETITKNFTNKHKKGNLKILKVDKDNNSITLGAIEFDLLDEEKNIIEHLKTDVNGEVYIENINIGNYTLKETLTKKEYNLCVDENIIVEWNETSKITIENEKKKGEIEIYKTDADDNNIKLKDIEFHVFNKDKKFIEKITTNDQGYAKTSRLPIGTYYIKEVKTNNKYVLDNKMIKVNVEDDVVTTLNITNRKKKGKIAITKFSSSDSPVFNIKKGDLLQDVKFEIYDDENKLVDTIVTDENGEAVSKELEIGKYKVIESETTSNFILNKNEIFINIEKDGDIKILEVENDPIKPGLNIEKDGPEEAKKNEEIKYDFEISNTGNSKLENFIWTEYIPFEKIKVTKMITGIYNQNIDYKILYKTNKNDYKMFKELNTTTSEYLDFNNIELSKDEEIIELKVEFGTVNKEFISIVNPSIFAKVKDNVKKDDLIINKTDLTGEINGKILKDEDDVLTRIKEVKMEKKLPRTGC